MSAEWKLVASALALWLGTTGLCNADNRAQTVPKEPDPLSALPPVLFTGKALPGDAAPLACPAQASSLNDLSLATAVDLALCNNPQVQSAWASIKVQAEALGEAQAAFLPTASASVSRLSDKTTYPGTVFAANHLANNMVYGSFSWRLFDFGGREASRQAALALLNAALANHDATLQKTLSGVIQAYFDAQTAQATWQAKQKTEALARETLEATQRREARGAGAQSDTLQAATALAKASLDKGRARGTYQKNLAILIYAMGISPSSEVGLDDDWVEQHDGPNDPSLGRDLQDWLEQAQTQHPAIAAAKAQWEAAKQKVTVVHSDGLPTVDFSANLYQNGRPNQGLTPTTTREKVAGVTLTIPIFDGFAHGYRERGAIAQAEEKEADLRDTEHQVLMDVLKAHADAVSALENLEASSKLHEAAELALASVQRKFDKGAADILQILSTQAALADAQQERIRCLADWRSARLRLLASVGGMSRHSAGL